MLLKYYFSEYLSEDIDDIIMAYFKHKHIPRGLFHTDHAYIIRQLSEEPCVETNVRIFDKHRSSDKERFLSSQKNRMINLQTLYTLRVAYPKESYTNKQTETYELEMHLYDRVLFNELKRNSEIKEYNNSHKPVIYSKPEDIGKQDAEYLEPIYFLKMFKNNIISTETPLKKGVYMTLYLALKEVEWKDFQYLFPKIKDDAQKTYDISNLISFSNFISDFKIKDDIKKRILVEINTQIEEDKPQMM